WDEYLHHTQNRPQTKGYYYKNHLRLEMSQFFEHGKYHVAIIFAVNLFATLKGIPATGLDTTTPIF
ncbi:MAG: Uma2 family endonuclease, partial [Jaaginema sp. PMC 1079.18]|nr:Uma2 family endonuclease [Jaaginema sp. PMC 1079.18]